MHMRIARLRPFITVAFALFCIDSPANAQLGGLIRKARDKAQEATRSPEKPKEAVKAPGSRSQGPEFDGHTLEITDERVDQILKGLAAEKSARENKTPAGRKAWKEHEDQAFAARQKDYDLKLASFKKDSAAWTAKDSTLNLCHSAVTRKYRDGHLRDPKRKIEDDNCGVHAGMPPQWTEPEPTPAPAEPPDPVSVGARASGLGGSQYAEMRERMKYLVSRDANLNLNGPEGGAYTAGELAAVKKRLVELKAARCC